jgi:hypothetical protein
LTPNTKRGLPLYKFILIALSLLTARYLALMVLYTDLEVGSAYYNVAADYADGQTIHSIIGIVLVFWLPPFALLFVILCLYVQGKCVLVLIALNNRYIYKAIMSYLLTLSVTTLVLRMVYAAFLTLNQFDSHFSLPNWMNTTALATFTATILSWSLIFTWQVGTVISNRYQLGESLEKSEGLAILFMTGIESMLIPSQCNSKTPSQVSPYTPTQLTQITHLLVIFTILQLTHVHWFPNAEYLIMPSVACIIPFGSIWASASNQHASLQRAIQNKNTAAAAAPNTCASCSCALLSRASTNTKFHVTPTTIETTNSASSFSSSPTLLNPYI